METIQSRPTSFSFWKAYLIHMRPYLWFISGFAGLSGVFIFLDQVNYRFYFSLIPFFLSYGFGQALTDCSQIDTDKISSQYRPLSMGTIRKKDVFWVSLIGLIVCGGILLYLHLLNAILAGLSIIGLATYSYIKKHFWPLGPPYNAFIVSLLPVMGYLGFMPSQHDFDLKVILPVAVVLFLAYSIFVLMGYLKDITADRIAGYNTFTVRWGWNITVFVSDFVYLLVFIIVYMQQWASGYSMVFFILGITSAITGQLNAHFQKLKKEEFASFSIIQSVRAFLFVSYTIICFYNQAFFYPLFFAHIAFELTIYFRPEKSQI